MRLAIFSDVHGNLESLDAFIENAGNRAVDHYVCLGDVVGYGASPNACFERIDTLPNLTALLGNHDAAAIWQASPYEMSPRASRAILWTMEQLAPHHTERIKKLEELIRLEDMVLCHANPYNPTGWGYVITWFSAVRSFLAARGRITFVGHTHRPKVMIRKKGLKIEISAPPKDGCMRLSGDCRYIINCGAIGQPRDGNPNASYVLFDTETQQIEFVRYAYDIDGAAKRIRDAGLPKYLAERLFKGR